MMFQFIPEYPDATDEQKMEQVRNWRNAQLAGTDWTQVADAPVDKQAWATYRQQLRDFPSTWTPGQTAEFPDPPGGE